MMEDKTFSEKFENYIIEQGVKLNHSGLKNQTVYRFPNGYGASVIFGEWSYGLELAVLEFEDEETAYITYDTPVTDNVVGDIEDLDEVLQKVKDIPEADDEENE